MKHRGTLPRSERARLERNHVHAMVYNTLLALIRSTGAEGIPGGIIFLRLQDLGCNYDQYTLIMAKLERHKLVERREDRFYRGRLGRSGGTSGNHRGSY